MKTITHLLLLLAALCTPALAQDKSSDDMYAKARDVVSDLQRIVAPTGIQETCKARIGGIDQWINVRGQDRDNPVILFIHRSEAHTSELQSLMRISYAVFCLKTKNLHINKLKSITPTSIYTQTQTTRHDTTSIYQHNKTQY